ncbi:hypothetical protein BKA62DRAFT_775940 [Auriculariales sp. MPI-PUGE-AT-0066]|nr:hypothetical protein BKA62DRAFT_775940 [Auriculariales sp. MPI-PUGE-AT-0066]
MQQIAVENVPTELLLLIFEYASGRHSDQIDFSSITRSTSGQKLLASCALVCKRWSTLVPRVLYRDVMLSRVDPDQCATATRTTSSRVQQLCDTLVASPSYAGFVDFVHLDVGRQPHYWDAYTDGQDEGATLSDLARLIASAPSLRARHISLTLESTPGSAMFAEPELDVLATIAHSVKHLTVNDVRPVCHGHGDEEPETRAAREPGTPFELLLQLLHVWPSVSRLAFSGSHEDFVDVDVDQEDEPTPVLMLPELRELRVHGRASLPRMCAPLLDSLQWVGPTADVVSSMSPILGLGRLAIWDLGEVLDLSAYQSVQSVRIDVAIKGAWDTLKSLPPSTEQLVLSGVDAQASVDTVNAALFSMKALRQLVLLDGQKRRQSTFLGCTLPSTLLSQCQSRGIWVTCGLESMDTPWDVAPRI